ncbi:hypothetical protein V8D89_005431 [Ganoderma adspersum]
MASPPEPFTQSLSLLRPYLFPLSAFSYQPNTPPPLHSTHRPYSLFRSPKRICGRSLEFLLVESALLQATMAPLATRSSSDDTSNDGASGGTPHGVDSTRLDIGLAMGVVAVAVIAYLFLLFLLFKVHRAPKTSGSTSPGAPSDSDTSELIPAARRSVASPDGTVQLTEADLVRALCHADLLPFGGGLRVAAPKPPKPAFHSPVAVSRRVRA